MLTPIVLAIAFPDEIVIILSLVVFLLLLVLRRSLVYSPPRPTAKNLP